ncbi:hypothetical protein JVU11DRAFT_5741 [Chiua virens]|nr:hypothetical protein JVU11DRAFT_5741 [Chiua virens]
MPRFVCLVLLAAYTANLILAAPQLEAGSPDICEGYMWGVTIDKLSEFGSTTVYNQYVRMPNCAGPAWVESSTNPDPPASINPRGITYECEVPATQYYCFSIPVATCCGKFGESA